MFYCKQDFDISYCGNNKKFSLCKECDNYKVTKKQETNISVIFFNLKQEIEKLLFEICHSPGCKRIRVCPRQCSCRNNRRFELNTITAICWMLGHTLSDIYSIKNMSRYIWSALFIHHLSQFHMTKGWQEFFLDVYVIASYLDKKENIRIKSKDIMITIDNLRSKYPRLKRDLKN